MATAHVAEDYPVRMVGLKALTIDPEIQSRCRTDMAHSRSITDFVLKNGPINEPVVVFDDGDLLWVADGFHRVHGYTQAARVNKRFRQIRCEIRPGSRIDAMVFSAGANQTRTYLARTSEDIKRSVFMLRGLPDWADAPNPDVAKHVGISDSTARKWTIAFMRETGKPVRTARRRDAPSEPRLLRSVDSTGKARFYTYVDGVQVSFGCSGDMARRRFEEFKASPGEQRPSIPSAPAAILDPEGYIRPTLGHIIRKMERLKLASLTIERVGGDVLLSMKPEDDPR